MILISKTPLRVSLFGGGTDFPEFFKKKNSIIIGGSIDKYIYITLNKYYSNLFKHKLKFFYSKLEFVKSYKDINHPVIKEVFYREKIKENVELHIASDLPSNSGLGSSSSFSVGLINLINTYKKKKLQNKSLAYQAIKLEREYLKETVGFQDQIFASLGGFQKIEIHKDKKFKVLKYGNQKLIKAMQKNLFIVFTGIKRNAKKIETKKIKKIEKNFSKLDKIRNIAIEVDKKLKSERNPDFIGHYLNETWKNKKLLNKNVSNLKINKLYNFCIKNGATGGKLLGAGAGGFILLYVPRNNQKNFKKKLKDKIVNFKFVNHGSKIIKI